MTTITYHFEDGTKQVSQINNAVLFDDKGKKRTAEQINNVFETTRHDLGAVSFEL